MFNKVKDFIFRYHKLLIGIFAVVILLVILLSSCQGLVNANGEGNEIIFSRQNQEVRINDED